MLAVAELCLALDAAPTWTVDPALPGPDLPRAGHSLFDRITAGGTDIPFPFARLVAQIEKRSGCQGSPCTRQVLIPLGRSLQRMTAAPEFFQSPRVVLAVTSGSAVETLGVDVKDRLFIGYQEQGAVIEVISYNEAAARFEFQLVKNYAAGKQPELRYTNRAVCIACHQNHAPIFSQQTWAETNANPRVADRLSLFGAERYGVPVRIGLKTPSDIDESVARANLLGAQQILWREACGARTENPVANAASNQCRAGIMRAALQYALSGYRGFDATRAEFKAAVALVHRNAQRLWPRGLAISDASLPNRDPLHNSESVTGAVLAHVPARFDPLQARAPLEVWTTGQIMSDRLITGIAQSLEADRKRIDADLQARARQNGMDTSSATVTHKYRANCTLTAVAGETRFACRSRASASEAVNLVGRFSRATHSGALESITVAGGPALHYFTLQGVAQQASQDSFAIHDQGFTARLTDGKRMQNLRFVRRGAETIEAELDVVDDFVPLDAALNGIAQDPKHFPTPVSLLSALPGGFVARCCDDKALPPPRVVASEVTANIAAAKALEPYCGACHSTAEATPPNFLYGDATRVRAALTSCAPRIAVRLAMWDLAPSARQKTPMPPALPALSGDANRTAPVSGEILASLRKAVTELARDGASTTADTAPALSALLARNYETLPLCLPSTQRNSPP